MTEPPRPENQPTIFHGFTTPHGGHLFVEFDPNDNPVAELEPTPPAPPARREDVITVLRWKAGEPRISRVFNALAAEHLAVGAPCPMCKHLFEAGQRTRLFVVGALDQADAAAMREGRWFSAAAQVIHDHCAHTASALVLIEHGTRNEARAADQPPPDPEPVSATLAAVDTDEFEMLVRYAGHAADIAAMKAAAEPTATAAHITRAAVRAAFELALGNQLITVVPHGQWPKYVAMNPPYEQPEWARGTGVVDEP